MSCFWGIVICQSLFRLLSTRSLLWVELCWYSASTVVPFNQTKPEQTHLTLFLMSLFFALRLYFSVGHAN